MDQNNYAGHPAFGMAAPPPYDGNQKIYHHQQQHPQQQQLPYDGYQQINQQQQQHPQRQKLPYDGYQQIYQQQQQHPRQQHPQTQQLPMCWADLCREIEQTTHFKNQNLPLARIKKIMKADEDVSMVALETPVVFARACELFILDLTYRAWCHAQESKRGTLVKKDVAAAITRTDVFDFMVDLVPREEARDDVFSPPLDEDPLSCYYIQQKPS